MAHGLSAVLPTIAAVLPAGNLVLLWEDGSRRGDQYGKMGLRRELHYAVTTADEGLRPISPLKLKLPPPPSSRRFQTSQKTLFSLVMFI